MHFLQVIFLIKSKNELNKIPVTLFVSRRIKRHSGLNELPKQLRITIHK